MKTEHYTTLIAILAILVIGVILALNVMYPKGILQSQKTVTVSASGTAEALPSQGVIDLYVNATGNTTALANANLSMELAKLNTTLLKYAGQSNITTQYYSIGTVHNTSTYVAAENIHILINNVNNMTNALLGISSHANVYVQSAQAAMSSQQSAQLLRSALKNALNNATVQAEALTDNASLTTANITTSTYHIFAPLTEGTASVAQVPHAQSGPLFFNGNETIVGTVQVVFSYG